MSGAAPASPCVLVTGASSGMGRRTAELLVARGFRVFGTSRRPDRVAANVEMLELDVRSEGSVERCVAEVEARAGALDVLVNNAGVEHLGIAEETSAPEARAVFETNFFGAVRMVNAVLPAMRQRGRGRIVNVGSLAAWVGEPGEAFYSASKSALARYSEALRYELAPLGIRVALVEPGASRTAILRAASASPARIADYDVVRDAMRQTVEAALQRGGDPEGAAKRIVAAISDRVPKARYPAGLDAVWVPLLKTLLPGPIFDRLLLQAYGLPRSGDLRAA